MVEGAGQFGVLPRERGWVEAVGVVSTTFRRTIALGTIFQGSVMVGVGGGGGVRDSPFFRGRHGVRRPAELVVVP